MNGGLRIARAVRGRFMGDRGARSQGADRGVVVNWSGDTIRLTPAGALGHLDTVTVDGVFCSVQGWVADGQGRPAAVDAVTIGATRVPGVRIDRVSRPDVRTVVSGVDGDDDGYGFLAAFSLLDVSPGDLESSTVRVGGEGLEVVGEWPGALVVRAAQQAPLVPDRPFMPVEVRSRIAKLLKGAACYLEYGTGGSTILASRLGVPRTYSVESDPSWLSVVEHGAADIPERGRQTFLHADLGPVGPWGYPSTRRHGTQDGDYALEVWSRMESDGASPDLVLIDGRYRVACFLASLLHARPGTCILFDDYLDRPEYQVVTDVLSPSALHGRLAEFTVPDHLAREDAWRLLARHAGDDR